ncbi:MAG: hypothetical protein IPK50_24050 [Fibrobacterota bacterium]|nr:MAG: hypothetical protein IPK50_24050 [Fibrobacterota bacterium]
MSLKTGSVQLVERKPLHAQSPRSQMVAHGSQVFLPHQQFGARQPRKEQIAQGSGRNAWDRRAGRCGGRRLLIEKRGSENSGPVHCPKMGSRQVHDLQQKFHDAGTVDFVRRVKVPAVIPVPNPNTEDLPGRGDAGPEPVPPASFGRRSKRVPPKA